MILGTAIAADLSGHALFTAIAYNDHRESMGRLFQRIRRLVAEGRYAVGDHASDMLEARGIMEWQAVAGLLDGTLLNERPNSRPNASVEVDQALPDGTSYKAVWSYLPSSNAAKLVTAHFYTSRRP